MLFAGVGKAGGPKVFRGLLPGAFRTESFLDAVPFGLLRNPVPALSSCLAGLLLLACSVPHPQWSIPWTSECSACAAWQFLIAHNQRLD